MRSLGQRDLVIESTASMDAEAADGKGRFLINNVNA
jgi:hypothetical protein